jgi:hypothetical protein
VIAALFALVGTNTQARLARQILLADKDPLIAEAGGLWTPMPRWLSWLSRPSHRRRLAAIENEVRNKQERATRYDRLCAELFAWNALESSVAFALPASVILLIYELA